MIIGMDHIALSCRDIHESINSLNQCGYKEKFVQLGLSNPVEKNEYLKQYHNTHDMSWCSVEGGVPIEIIVHSSTPASATLGYTPIFSALPNGCVSNTGNLQIPDEALETGGQLQSAYWEFFQTLILYKKKNSTTNPAIHTIALPADDLEESMQFWNQGLGFKICNTENTGKNNSYILSFVSPNPAWCIDLLIYKSSRIEKPMLDDAGFPCTAFLSTNIKKDLDIIKANGGKEISETFVLYVDGKNLDICMLRDPSENLVELIQISKGNK